MPGQTPLGETRDQVDDTLATQRLESAWRWWCLIGVLALAAGTVLLRPALGPGTATWFLVNLSRAGRGVGLRPAKPSPKPAGPGRAVVERDRRRESRHHRPWCAPGAAPRIPALPMAGRVAGLATDSHLHPVARRRLPGRLPRSAGRPRDRAGGGARHRVRRPGIDGGHRPGGALWATAADLLPDRRLRALPFPVRRLVGAPRASTWITRCRQAPPAGRWPA